MNPNRPGAGIPEPPIGFGGAGRGVNVDAAHTQGEPPPVPAFDAGEPRSNDNPEGTPEPAGPLGAKWLAAPALIVALAIVAIVVF